HLPKVPSGSVLVAITGQGKTRGTSAVLGMEATINQHIAFIMPRVLVASPEFIHLALTAAYLQLRALSEDSGSTKGAITCEDLKRFKIPMPPVPEQEALLNHIHWRPIVHLRTAHRGRIPPQLLGISCRWRPVLEVCVLEFDGVVFEWS
ncbi:MAG: restriction endonuclease subunit S, partial [Planctomycetota bacterium]|nr:restriction endonuclease subunit S [Planctomycetota bacterium]